MKIWYDVLNVWCIERISMYICFLLLPSTHCVHARTRAKHKGEWKRGEFCDIIKRCEGSDEKVSQP